jgi:propionyl-CoA carboxylase alpha chain
MELPVEEEEEEKGNPQTVAFLGPPAGAIRDMGCKVRSKEIAKDAGVTIIPGMDGELQSIDNALEIMNNYNIYNLDYPILLKAAAGGGGKGMRICYNEKELIEFYPLAQSEGLKYFNDDRLLIEKYINNPHHIEFQVICSPSNDNNNTNNNTNNNNERSIDVAIFPERECSIQRRNQKVIEESPSYNLLTEETRHTMMIQTAKLCQQVQYIGAGTIEWLVESDNDNDNDNNNDDDDDDDGQNENQKKQQFYFLEMNTRLQVEHPITESITNTDLVDAMLRVGSGNGLPLDWYNVATTITPASNDDNDNDGDILVIPWKGHSIEARIYAEDPLRGYLPSTGPLVPYKEPYGAITVLGKEKTKEVEVENEIISSPSSSGMDLDLSSSSYLRLDSGVAEGHVGM